MCCYYQLYQCVVIVSVCCYYSNVLLLFQCPFSTDFREIEWSAPCLVPCPVPGSGRHDSADPTLDLVSFKRVLLVLGIRNYHVLQDLCFVTYGLSCYCVLQLKNCLATMSCNSGTVLLLCLVSSVSCNSRTVLLLCLSTQNMDNLMPEQPANKNVTVVQFQSL